MIINDDMYSIGPASKKGGDNGRDDTHLALEKPDVLAISLGYEPFSDTPEALDGVRSEERDKICYQIEKSLKDRQDKIIEMTAETYSDAGDKVEHKASFQLVHVNGKSSPNISECYNSALNSVSGI